MNFRKTVVEVALAVGILWAGAEVARSQSDAPLRIAAKAAPDMIDMTQATNPPQGWATLINVYDKLVTNNPDGSVAPALAESWEVSEDGKVITMHLRHGVKFSSGDDFRAQDVVFSHARTLAIALRIRRSCQGVCGLANWNRMDWVGWTAALRRFVARQTHNDLHNGKATA
jgi:ABC-type transport system substrate-binding protein